MKSVFALKSTAYKFQLLAAVRGYELAVYAAAIAFLTHGVVCGLAIALAVGWLVQATAEVVVAAMSDET